MNNQNCYFHYNPIKPYLHKDLGGFVKPNDILHVQKHSKISIWEGENITGIDYVPIDTAFVVIAKDIQYVYLKSCLDGNTDTTYKLRIQNYTNTM